MNANLDTISVASKNGDKAETVEKVEKLGQVVHENMGDEAPSFEGIEKVFKLMRPGKVFGEPVVSGEYTVITASEVSMGGGFGMGKSTFMTNGSTSKEGEEAEASDAKNDTPGFGMGSGGGGGSMARPIALIVIGPDGVKVQPIFDLSKLIIAWSGMWGRVLLSLVRMNRRQKTTKAEIVPKVEIISKADKAKAEKA